MCSTSRSRCLHLQPELPVFIYCQYYRQCPESVCEAAACKSPECFYLKYKMDKKDLYSVSLMNNYSMVATKKLACNRFHGQSYG